MYTQYLLKAIGLCEAIGHTLLTIFYSFRWLDCMFLNAEICCYGMSDWINWIWTYISSLYVDKYLQTQFCKVFQFIEKQIRPIKSVIMNQFC